MNTNTVLNSQLGSIVAPAGCGKTHLITETLKIKPQKPYLVLTHTTAGLAALKQKLRNLDVPNQHFQIATIDGWALRTAKMFPSSCQIQSSLNEPNNYYPELRRVLISFLNGRHIEDIIKASYSRLLVDEYQDCNTDQHTLICKLSEVLPTIVFGDPLQTIFNFGNTPHPDWVQNIQVNFPQIGELENPWRWINAGTPVLGQWILNARNLLYQGTQINLQSCPNYITWQPLTGNTRTDSHNQNNMQFQLRNRIPNNETFLIIGDSTNRVSRHNFARTANGIDVVEPVDLGDITYAANTFDEQEGQALIEVILNSVSKMMTHVNTANKLQRLQSIISGRNRIPANPIEESAIQVIQTGSRNSIRKLLFQLEQDPNCRVYRKNAFSALKNTLELSISNPHKSILDAAKIVREERRHLGDRRIPNRAIGSILLLKGLEADHVLILNADSMNINHLYVALSRGAKSITIFSRHNLVGGT